MEKSTTVLACDGRGSGCLGTASLGRLRPRGEDREPWIVGVIVGPTAREAGSAGVASPRPMKSEGVWRWGGLEARDGLLDRLP